MSGWTWQDDVWRYYDDIGQLTYWSTAATMTADPPDEPPEEDGGASVREPRRPLPAAPAAAAEAEVEPEFAVL